MRSRARNRLLTADAVGRCDESGYDEYEGPGGGKALEGKEYPTHNCWYGYTSG